jgi:hypothetical protein
MCLFCCFICFRTIVTSLCIALKHIIQRRRSLDGICSYFVVRDNVLRQSCIIDICGQGQGQKKIGFGSNSTATNVRLCTPIKMRFYDHMQVKSKLLELYRSFLSPHPKMKKYYRPYILSFRF